MMLAEESLDSGDRSWTGMVGFVAEKSLGIEGDGFASFRPASGGRSGVRFFRMGMLKVS